MYNKVFWITAIIIMVLIVIYIFTDKYEGFTNDEAIQNVASLYNQAKLSVTDFTSTGTATLNNVNVANVANLNGQTNLNSVWVTKKLTATDILVGNVLTVGNGATITGPTNLQGALNVSGTLSGPAVDALQKKITDLSNQVNATIIKSPKWDVTVFMQLLQQGQYFNSSQPDGYTRRFIFVHPSGDVSTTVFDYWHAIVTKIGKQFFMWELNVPEHITVPNPASNSSNSVWRGNY